MKASKLIIERGILIVSYLTRFNFFTLPSESFSFLQRIFIYNDKNFESDLGSLGNGWDSVIVPVSLLCEMWYLAYCIFTLSRYIYKY